MKTTFLTTEQAYSGRGWALVDATDQPMGRLASEVASLLRGKRNPAFTPHTDCGDFVIVINADKITFTGNKLAKKVYKHHTGYTGGLKEETAEKLLARKPEEAIQLAVRGMLPKSALGRGQLSKLKVYRGAEHPHMAQNPRTISL